MADLKLIALDAEDLSVLSANLQDAVLRVDDIAYLPREKRFAAIANRFDWIDAGHGKGSYTRRRTAVRFEQVLSAQVQGIELANKSAVLSLLAISFEPGGVADNPEGHVTLHFADGAGIRLHVEYIEAELQDLGPVWQAKSMPHHPDDDPATV
jgi:Protein of unknown function (DUF2948)